MDESLQTKSTETEEHDPRGDAGFWKKELTEAKDRCADWHKKGTKIINRYLDDRKENDAGFRINLFYANVSTLEALLYASLPKVNVARRHLDANDDAARVSAVLVERLLNNDLQANGRERDAVLRAVLQDRLLPGLGCARVRYTMQKEQQAEVRDMMGFVIQPAQEVLVDEQAEVDYTYWQDVLWGWSRNWAELPWLAYRSYLSKEEVKERFPGREEEVQYVCQPASDDNTQDDDNSPHMKAEIWEIWDKAGMCVYWYGEGAAELLDHKDDPLQLTGFFPSPPFLLANQTTQLYRAVPDYHLHQDLYSSIDELQQRIDLITQAVKVVGLYDSNAEGVGRMLKEGCENDLIPVDNWAMFSEKGGLRGVIDWLPVEAVVNTLDKLRQLRDETISLLQQTTGMADVMRGSVNPYEGVGQTEAKAAWGSVRVQALQDQFAVFVSNLLQLQAEVMCRHFEPQTIVERANAQFLQEDPQIIQAALQLLKSPDRARLRVEVAAESVAMVDQHRVQSERAEFLNALSTFMQSMAPMVAQQPESMPYLLQMLQWVLSGFRGAGEIEGVLDRAIQQALEAQGQQKPDPQKEMEQMKAQVELQKIQAKGQADLQLRQADAQADMQSLVAAHQARMAEIQATHQAKMEEIEANLQASVYGERVNLEANIAATETSAAAEARKDALSSTLAQQEQMAKSAARIWEIEVQPEKEDEETTGHGSG